MITIYVVDVPEFQPLLDDARKRSDCRVKRLDSTYVTIESDQPLEFSRRLLGLKPAVWYGLFTGGLVLGILDPVTYEAGEVRLDPGDVLAVVTDGVTEANSPDEREFGDERVCKALRALSGESAGAILDGLLTAVNQWTGAAGSSDDLTALVLKAR